METELVYETSYTRVKIDRDAGEALLTESGTMAGHTPTVVVGTPARDAILSFAMSMLAGCLGVDRTLETSTNIFSNNAKGDIEGKNMKKQLRQRAVPQRRERHPRDQRVWRQLAERANGMIGR